MRAGNKPYMDEKNSNNYRRLTIDKSWFNESLKYRIPFVYKETMGTEHEDFIIKLMIDFEATYAKWDTGSLIFVYHDSLQSRQGDIIGAEFDGKNLHALYPL